MRAVRVRRRRGTIGAVAAKKKPRRKQSSRSATNGAPNLAGAVLSPPDEIAAAIASHGVNAVNPIAREAWMLSQSAQKLARAIHAGATPGPRLIRRIRSAQAALDGQPQTKAAQRMVLYATIVHLAKQWESGVRYTDPGDWSALARQWLRRAFHEQVDRVADEDYLAAIVDFGASTKTMRWENFIALARLLKCHTAAMKSTIETELERARLTGVDLGSFVSTDSPIGPLETQIGDP